MGALECTIVLDCNSLAVDFELGGEAKADRDV
jgi:hypothetical protein